MGNDFKIGDILTDENEAFEVIVIAKEYKYYRAIHISGLFDKLRARIYHPEWWRVVGNIFEKKRRTNDGRKETDR